MKQQKPKTIKFCGKQIESDGFRSCGITQICDLTSENDAPNGLNSIYICKVCLNKLNGKQK